MSDIDIRRESHAGRITLNRPKALNALTYDMIRSIESALDDWRNDDKIALVLIDANGDKAFCAGGDIAEMYRTGIAGDFAYGQQFWRDEYRMNAKLARYPKPVVSFMQGFTMGGGVGVGCHGSHRVVSEKSVVAMPECGIGLVPDVGGSLILARAPGHIGTYLGITTRRVTGVDIIYTGFADHLVDDTRWDDLKAELTRTGDPMILSLNATRNIDATASLPTLRPLIDQHFSHGTLSGILASLRNPTRDDGDDATFCENTLAALAKVSPLSAAFTVEMLHRLRMQDATIEDALAVEYRFTARAMKHGDFLEGIRAAIIDKDRSPNWKHSLDDVPQDQVAAMLAPLQKEFTP